MMHSRTRNDLRMARGAPRGFLARNSQDLGIGVSRDLLNRPGKSGEGSAQCRRCGREGTPRDTVVRRLSHEPLGWRPTTLLVTIRRYRCIGCGHVWRAKMPPGRPSHGRGCRVAVCGGHWKGSFDEDAPLEPGSCSDRTSAATRWGAFTARYRCCADSMSLKAIATPAALEPGPLVTRWRSRPVAKVDSIGFVVRRWIQCSGGVSRRTRVLSLCLG